MLPKHVKNKCRQVAQKVFRGNHSAIAWLGIVHEATQKKQTCEAALNEDIEKAAIAAYNSGLDRAVHIIREFPGETEAMGVTIELEEVQSN